MLECLEKAAPAGDIVHANVKEPLSPLLYPRTTNHSLRGVDPEFVAVCRYVSGSSVQMLYDVPRAVLLYLVLLL